MNEEPKFTHAELREIERGLQLLISRIDECLEAMLVQQFSDPRLDCGNMHGYYEKRKEIARSAHKKIEQIIPKPQN